MSDFQYLVALIVDKIDDFKPHRQLVLANSTFENGIIKTRAKASIF